MHVILNYKTALVVFSSLFSILCWRLIGIDVNILNFFICAAPIVIFCVYVVMKQSYWKRRNVSFSPPTFLVGHLLRRMGITEPFWKFYDNIYYNYNGNDFCGIYDFLRPVLMVGCPEKARNILIKEFNNFSIRISFKMEKVSPIANVMIANLSGEKWNTTRRAISPVFTALKLKQMFPIISERCDVLIHHLRMIDGKQVKLMNCCGEFTIETILACAMGVEFEKENVIPECVEMGKRMFIFSLERTIKMIFLVVAPTLTHLAGYLGYSIASKEFKYFENKVMETLKYRRENSVSRNDFLDMVKDNKLSQSSIVSQAILFLLAGYNNSNFVLCFAMHHLAFCQDVQDKLRQEIKDLEESMEDDDLCTTISKSTYMDVILKEIMRLYPVDPVLQRETVNSTKLPGTDIILEKGQKIIVPVWSMQRDPKYWYDPENFIPERFLKEKNNPAFMPFGLGPRNCLGKKFAEMVIKTGLWKIVTNFKISPSEDSVNPPPLNHRAIQNLQCSNGIPLKLTPL